jgi:hypothetical protein
MKSYLQETVEWHQEQYEKLQAQINQLQAKIDELIEGCNFHKNEISRVTGIPICSGEIQKNPRWITKQNEANYDIPPPEGLDPREMMRATYKGLGMNQAILKALENLGGEAKTLEIAEEIYDAQNPEDFKRCRQSLGATLRAGDGIKGWKKLAFGKFGLMNEDKLFQGVNLDEF